MLYLPCCVWREKIDAYAENGHGKISGSKTKQKKKKNAFIKFKMRREWKYPLVVYNIKSGLLALSSRRQGNLPYTHFFLIKIFHTLLSVSTATLQR